MDCTLAMKPRSRFDSVPSCHAGDGLFLRLRRWITLARQVGVRRFLLDGSFVTAKPDPDDIDAVVLLPASFQSQVERDVDAALDLEQMLLTRRPEELFAAEDDADWLE